MNSVGIGEAHGSARAAYRRWALYGLVVLATIAVFFVIRRYGETPTAPAAPAGGPSTAMVGSRNEALFRLLLALAAVMALVTTIAASPVLRLLHPQTDG